MKIIIGKPKSGKTSFILDSVYKMLSGKQSPLVIVPTRFRKDSLIADTACKTGGFAGRVFATLNELAPQVISVSEFARNTRVVSISSFEAYLMVKMIIEEIKDDLIYFKEIELYEGVVNLIFSMIMELRAGMVFSSDSGVFKNEGDKWRDICLIYDEYEKRIEQNALYDEYMLYRKTAEILDAENSLKIIDGYDALFIDGFLDFTNTQFHFLSSLINRFERLGKEVSLTLPDTSFPLISNTQQLFIDKFNVDISKLESENRFVDIANSFLESSRKIDFESDVQFFEINSFGKYREVELIANEIKYLVFDKGYRFNDIGVIVRNFEDYENFIRTVFDSFNIPYYQGKDTFLKTNPVIIFIYSIMRYAMEGIDNIGITAIVNSNYNANEEWKNLSRFLSKFSGYIRGDKAVWIRTVDSKLRYLERKKELRYSGEDDEEMFFSDEELNLSIDEIKNNRGNFSALLDMVFFLDKQKKYTVDDFLRWIVNIIECLGIHGALVEKGESLWISTKDFMAFRSLKLVLEKLKRSLTIYGKEKFSLSDFMEIFTELIGEVRYRYQVYTEDCVKVLTPQDAREAGFKAVFITGLNESEFPGRPSFLIADNAERIKINDYSKRLLHGADEPLGTEEKRGALEKLDFYVAMTTVSERLYFCHTPFDESGEEILPSVFLYTMRNILNNNIRRIPDLETPDDKYSDKIFEIVPSLSWININDSLTLISNDLGYINVDKRIELAKHNGVVDCAVRMKRYYDDLKRVYNYFEGNSADKAPMIYFGDLSFDGAGVDDEKNRDYITGKLDAMRYSASGLETAGNCRYCFFIRYILGIREEKFPEEKITLQQKGLFFHRVLYYYLSFTKDFISDRLPDYDAMEKSVDKAFQELADKEGERNLFIMELESYRKILNRFAEYEKLLREEYKPFGFEEFISEKIIEIGEGEAIRINGQIDRTDISEEGYKIIDYKSGSVDRFKDDAFIPLKVFQGYVYAKALDLPITCVSYVSITTDGENKFEQKVVPLSKHRSASINDFEEIWKIKATEISYLIDLFKNGNFYPYTCIDDFEANEGILDFYSQFHNAFDDIKLESDTKCRFCAYLDSCLRDKKLMGSW
jgi:ATP-dependent helicase/nuclease subunit B